MSTKIDAKRSKKIKIYFIRTFKTFKFSEK